MKSRLLKTFGVIIVLHGLLYAQHNDNIQVKKNSFVFSISSGENRFKDSTINKYTIRDYYDCTDPSRPGTYKLPSKDILIALPPNSIRHEFKLVSSIEKLYENYVPAVNGEPYLSKDSVITLKNVGLKRETNSQSLPPIIEVQEYIWVRDFYCAHLKINNFTYNERKSTILEKDNIKIEVIFDQQVNLQSSSPLRIKSTYDSKLKEMIINADIAEQFRSNVNTVTNDTTGNWINYDAKYLKLGTTSDNLFRIYKTDLDNYGINTSSIDSHTFQLFNNGKEVAIFIANESSGLFTDSSYIEFYGTKNYSPTSCRNINKPEHDYNEYLNRYTDTTYFFLTWNQKNGLRAKTNSSTGPIEPDTINYYYDLQHMEKNTMYQNLFNDEVDNQMPGWFRNKTWYWDWLFVGKKNYNFTASDLYPNKPSYFYSKLVSCASNVSKKSHNIIFCINDTKIDSQIVDRFQQVLLKGTINSDKLVRGTNRLTIQSIENGTSPNQIANDWYEIEYPKYLSLQNDSISFKINEDISNGLHIVKIKDVSIGNFVIYKTSGSLKKITEYSIVSGSLLFQDSLKAGDTYIVIDQRKIKKPNYYYMKKFENVRNNNDQTDYIAITHPDFLTVATKYVEKISSHYGLSSRLVNVQSIYDEFGYGYPYPESIKLFMETAFRNMISPKPSYLTLIGDANYDYKHYRYINDGVLGGGNYIPSYGNPVSDSWYVIWPDVAPNIPQLIVGRIPINNSSELEYYLSKIENNINSSFGEFNKRFLFFSGGYGSDQREFDNLRSQNDSIIARVVKPRPVSGIYTHFYKTISPPSDLGPYTQKEIQNAISNGGLFISYLGHSGTATWDNGINETNQLMNDVKGNPIITDFGCSTNKFAEPDIICFGERFVLNKTGQALNYIGNSSLGFTSTAFTIPKIFYQSLLDDSLHIVGNAHISSKNKMFETYGSSSTYRIFALTNAIIGDPAVRIKFPNKSNLRITSSQIFLPTEIITENTDSTQVKLIVNNYGLSFDKNIQISITHSMGQNVIERKSMYVPMPNYLDTITTWIYVKSLPGDHEIVVTLDPENKVDEIYENDNTAKVNVFVSSQAVRDLISNIDENSFLNQLTILNPSFYSKDPFQIIIQTSSDNEFKNNHQFSTKSQVFYTKITLNSLEANKRYWYRYKIDETSSVFSLPKSFITSGTQKFNLTDSLTFNDQKLMTLKHANNSLIISEDSVKIMVLSAGYYCGATCVIKKNGTNLLSNTFFAGMGIVVFDQKTFKVDTTAWFQLWDSPANVQSLANLINSIPEGKIVAMGVADDARNNLSTALKNAIKTLGSTKIDSLVFRGSWALIGKKGAKPGEVIEQVKGPYGGTINLDSSFIAKGSEGYLLTKKIGPASIWRNVTYNKINPNNSQIGFQCFGIKKDENVDTLKSIVFADTSASLAQINAKIYPKLMFKADYKAASDGTSPEIKKFAVDYIQPPELGINYQTVSLSADSVLQGHSVKLDFSIYNVGESDADSFYVNVYLNLPNKNQRMLFDTLITKLKPFTKVDKNLSYDSNYDDGYGSFSFTINVDKEQNITEIYKDNNYFNKSFYVIRDSITDVTSAKISFTFDGLNIMDGDYVSSKPKIEFTLNYGQTFNYSDTGKVNFLIDGKRLLYSSMDSINYDTINRVVVFKIQPQLEDGEHLLRITGEDLSNQQDELQRTFNVSNDLKILDIYNYPNPFGADTYFTFNLTIIPDELYIKIYTVAGRLIKEIRPLVSGLNVNFNKIYWDGRDSDGDAVANGVYLYKIIAKLKDKTFTNIQKCARVQ